STSATAPQFVADLPNATYQVSLIITDVLGNFSAPAFAMVTTSSCGANPPTITLTPPTGSVNANTDYPLAFSATDDDNTCGFTTSVTSVSWSVVSSPAGSAPSLVSSFTNTSNSGTPPTFTASNSFRADQASAGTDYVVRAVATASNGTQASKESTITVNACGSHAPVITGFTTSVALPAAGTTVNVTAQTTDADSGCVSSTPTVTWTLVSAPSGSLAATSVPVGPASSTLTGFSVDLAGTYVL